MSPLVGPASPSVSPVGDSRKETIAQVKRNPYNPSLSPQGLCGKRQQKARDRVGPETIHSCQKGCLHAMTVLHLAYLKHCYTYTRVYVCTYTHVCLCVDAYVCEHIGQ